MRCDDADAMQGLPPLGSTLADKYVLERIIGAGGMGVVFEAAQPALGRSVAIKMIAPALASAPSARRRFADEARNASRLSHPNVAAILDVGEISGLPFLVMELVRGPSLTRIVADDGMLDPRRAARLIAQMLAALGEAHAADLVHGDMKSDNVLVETARDGSERVKIVDFGLARLASRAAAARDEHPDVVSGTPEYMAPELIEGQPRTARSDVYATGIIFYELLTGETPFAGATSSEILARQKTEPIVPPSLRRSDGAVPPSFDLIVLRALAKDPDARFADTERFAIALAEAMQDLPDQAASEAHVPHSITERPTVEWNPADAPHPLEREDRARAHLAASLAHGSADQVVEGYLAFSRALVSSDRMRDAIRELEEGALLLDGEHAPPSLWKLLVALASLYEASGTTADARRAAATGYRQAAAGRSEIGIERASALLDRLARCTR